MMLNFEPHEGEPTAKNFEERRGWKMEKELVLAFYDLAKELKQASPEQKIALVQCMLDVYTTVLVNHS